MKTSQFNITIYEQPYYNPYYIFERDNNLNIINVVHIIYSWFMVFTLNYKIIPVIDFYRSNIHI